MKLNTFHWLGIALLVAAIILIGRNRTATREPLTPRHPATAPYITTAP